MLAAKLSSIRQPFVTGITFLLILLWVYAATSKLLDYETSRSQMLNQVFPQLIGNILVWAVPLAELITAGLLIFDRTRTWGFYLSLFLLLQFTIYISLIMLNVFGRIPCSCGGILEEMSWGQHLVFNLFFIAITIVGLNTRDGDKGSEEGVLMKPPAVRRV